MLLWPVRWLLGRVFQATFGVLLTLLLMLWSFRWIPLVPVPVIVDFFSGKAPQWQWLRPSETPPGLLQAFRMRLEQTRQRRLSPSAQAAATLLYPDPENAWGAEFLGGLLTLLWGETRLYHLYLSGAPWGRSIWGAKSASAHYLQKDPKDLSFSDIAELILLREYPQAAQNSMRPLWFQKQKSLLSRQIAHASSNYP